MRRVTIAKATSLIEAQVIESILASEGIQCSNEVTSLPDEEAIFKFIFKKAVFFAIVGSFFLPIISNGVSVYYFIKSYKLNQRLFVQKKSFVYIGMFFNLGVLFLTGIALIEVFLRH